MSSALVFGSAIHAAVEFYFSKQLAGEDLPDLDLLLAVYQQSWRDRFKKDFRFGKKETADLLHQLTNLPILSLAKCSPTLARPTEHPTQSSGPNP